MASLLSVSAISACTGDPQAPTAQLRADCPYPIELAQVQQALEALIPAERFELKEPVLDGASVDVATSQESDANTSRQPALTLTIRTGAGDALPSGNEVAKAIATTITSVPVPRERALLAVTEGEAERLHWHGLTFRDVSREGIDQVIEVSQSCELRDQEASEDPNGS